MLKALGQALLGMRTAVTELSALKTDVQTQLDGLKSDLTAQQGEQQIAAQSAIQGGVDASNLIRAGYTTANQQLLGSYAVVGGPAPVWTMIASLSANPGRVLEYMDIRMNTVASTGVYGIGQACMYIGFKTPSESILGAGTLVTDFPVTPLIVNPTQTNAGNVGGVVYQLPKPFTRAGTMMRMGAVPPYVTAYAPTVLNPRIPLGSFRTSRAQELYVFALASVTSITVEVYGSGPVI